MMRILGLTFASGVTSIAVGGIATLIAVDFIGADGIGTIWNAVTAGKPLAAVEEAAVESTAPRGTPSRDAADDRDQPGFKPEKAIHFFEEVPITGTALSVTTGASYADVAAVTAKSPSRQWCYISLDERDGITGRVDLGSQVGTHAPVLSTADLFRNAELAPYGLDAKRLAGLALSHCRFNRLEPLG